MSATDVPPTATEENGGEKLWETSPSGSVVKEHSPAPESIHSNAEKQEKIETPKSKSPDEEEIKYPGTMTKFGVGVGLALVVFLVISLTLKFF